MTDLCLFFDASFLDHETGDCPERPERMRAVLRLLEHERPDLYHGVEAPPAATQDELLRAHTAEHIMFLQHQCAAGGGAIDGDTRLCQWSELAARRAAGAGVEACKRVLSGDHRRMFALVRPPGHHATHDRAMGFCLYNNAAVSALAALEAGAEKVAVVDVDAHHGNGTQDILWSVPGAHYFSIHLEPPVFPGTGHAEEVGAHDNVRNYPLPNQASPTSYFHALERLVGELRHLRPDLLILSVGFDTHWQDPVGGMNLHREDLRKMAQRLLTVADQSCGGRFVSILEGGYNLDTLPQLVVDHLAVLTA